MPLPLKLKKNQNYCFSKNLNNHTTLVKTPKTFGLVLTLYPIFKLNQGLFIQSEHYVDYI
jgi:hypothetical protein